jgi:type II secretory pathway pseudopilin PulG
MEVLTGLVLISIVSSIVLPGIANFYSGLQVHTEAEQFVQNVRLARYKAIEEQAVYRLIFDTDPAIEQPLAYRVQTHIAFDEGGGTYTTSGAYDYYDAQWIDAIESEEIMFDTGTTLVIDAVAPMPQVLFFWPNGMIYPTPDISNTSADTIAERYIGFNYGSAGIKVIITPMGVFSSESYAADMVDITDDNEVLW